MNAAQARCRREIDDVIAKLMAGETDIHGLLLALLDWSCELKLLEETDPCLF